MDVIVAKARGEYLRTHFKNMREVAAALSGEFCFNMGSCQKPHTETFEGMNLKKAYTYLADVQDHKQVVPFRRFAGGIGRASQAKQFKTTKGV